MIEPDTSGGKVLCFTVPSRSKPGVLRHVDLCDDSCDCEDYLWNKSETFGLSKEERRCWHINQARLHLVSELLPVLLKDDNFELADALDLAIERYAIKMGRKFE